MACYRKVIVFRFELGRERRAAPDRYGRVADTQVPTRSIGMAVRKMVLDPPCQAVSAVGIDMGDLHNLAALLHRPLLAIPQLHCWISLRHDACPSTAPSRVA